MKTYRESLKNIHNKLDKKSSAEKRIKLIHQLLPDDRFIFTGDEEFKVIFDYINSCIFRLQNRNKKKKDPLYENTYLSVGLTNISDFLLEKWNQWEGRNLEYEDNTIQSKYDLVQQAKDGNKKSIVGFDASIADDFLANSYTKTVMEGWEFHVDQLEKQTKKVDNIFNFSEDVKRAARKQLVLENLDNPDLREKFIVYKEMGLRYGFDESLSPEQKEEMKKQWIDHFSKDIDYPVKPKDRYYRLLKMYNDIGYELFKIIEQSQVKTKTGNQPLERSQTVEESAGAFVIDMMNLGIQQHVIGLLTIQKGKRMGEYFPLWMMLKEKYKGDEDSPFGMLESELNEVLEVTDLTAMEKDIVNLILARQENFSVYDIDNRNPFEHIANYVNEKYLQRKTKTDIVKMVDRNISRTIADTYSDLERGLDIKKCACCRKEKMASEHNFGKDIRNRDGLKSVCKKCVAKKAKNIRGII